MDTITVGTGATINLWSDRIPAHVVEATDRKIVVREAEAIVDPAFPPMSNIWIITPNPTGKPRTFTLRRNGRWIEQGQDMHTGVSLTVGTARKYYDYAF